MSVFSPSYFLSRHSNQAYTLIELLATAGIIALISTFSLGAFQTVDSHVKKVKCLSNLRQLGVAFSSYAADNNRTLPGYYYNAAPAPGNYRNDDLTGLSPYVNSYKIFVCPGTKNSVKTLSDLNHSAFSPSSAGTSYEYINFKNRYWGTPFLNTADKPTPIAYDSNNWGKDPSVTSIEAHSRLSGGNILFADGSVSWIEAKRWDGYMAEPVPQ